MSDPHLLSERTSRKVILRAVASQGFPYKVHLNSEMEGISEDKVKFPTASR